MSRVPSGSVKVRALRVRTLGVHSRSWIIAAAFGLAVLGLARAFAGSGDTAALAANANMIDVEARAKASTTSLSSDAATAETSGAAKEASPAAPAVRASLTIAGVKAIRREISARKGAPLLVNFWATWCEPCVDELPDLAKLESKYATKRLKLLGVSCDLMIEDNSAPLRQKVAHALSESGVSYPNFLYDGRSDPLIQAFNLPGPIPHTILFGADGKELHRWTGRLDITSLERVLGSL